MGAEVIWDDEMLADCIKLYRSGMSAAEVAKSKGLTRSQVIGKLNRVGVIGSRPKRRDYDESRARHRKIRAQVIASREVLNRGTWDEKLFEPWEVRKARLARERANGMS